MMKITMALAAVALAGCATHKSVPSTPFVPTAVVVEADKAYVSESVRSVREKMKDPDSARFYGVYTTKRVDDQAKPAVCGFVNSKNSYGGYVGKTRFLASGGFVALWEARPGPYGSVDNTLIRDNCTLRSGQVAPDDTIEWQ